MKKQIALIALAASTASVAFGELSVSGTFAYESAYVFRGKQLDEAAFQPSVDIAMPVMDGEFYAGIWHSNGFQPGNTGGEEVDFYAGFAYDVTDMFSVDAGLTYYMYPDSGGDADTTEMFFGVAADVLLSPAVYIYYDFTLEALTFEGSVGYSLDLAEYAGVEGASLDLGAYLGNTSNDSANNGYTYWGLTADLVYALNENVSTSLGGRYAGNNDDVNGDDSHLWFGASVGFSY